MCTDISFYIFRTIKLFIVLGMIGDACEHDFYFLSLNDKLKICFLPRLTLQMENKAVCVVQFVVDSQRLHCSAVL